MPETIPLTRRQRLPATLRVTPPMATPEKLYNQSAACRLLGTPGKPLPRMTLYRLAKHGLINRQVSPGRRPGYLGEEIINCWRRCCELWYQQR